MRLLLVPWIGLVLQGCRVREDALSSFTAPKSRTLSGKGWLQPTLKTLPVAGAHGRIGVSAEVMDLQVLAGS